MPDRFDFIDEFIREQAVISAVLTFLCEVPALCAGAWPAVVWLALCGVSMPYARFAGECLMLRWRGVPTYRSRWHWAASQVASIGFFYFFGPLALIVAWLFVRQIRR